MPRRPGPVAAAPALPFRLGATPAVSSVSPISGVGGGGGGGGLKPERPPPPRGGGGGGGGGGEKRGGG
ncbi:hypothetical protein AAHZ94_27175, partial [Streptomyces sp. HSW2009]